MSTKNARTLGIRLDEKEASALQEIEDSTGLAPVSALRIALKALIKRWHEKKRLILPFHVLGDDELTELKSLRLVTHGLNDAKPETPESLPPRQPVEAYPKPKRKPVAGSSSHGLRQVAEEHHKDEGHEGLH